MDLRSTALCIYICTSIGWRLHVDAIVYLSGLFSAWAVYKLLKGGNKWWECVLAVFMVYYNAWFAFDCWFAPSVPSSSPH